MQLTINIDDPDNQLSDSTLYLFRAAHLRNDQALPCVWRHVTPPFGSSLILSWRPVWSAFTSPTPVADGDFTEVTWSSNIAAGMRARIQSDGTFDVRTSSPGIIDFFNAGTTPWSCGLMQTTGANPDAPFCIFPLAPQDEQSITLSSDVLLLFSTAILPPGTIVQDAIDDGSRTQGVLLDASVPRALYYSTRTGEWEWIGGDWATTVEASEPIVPILIGDS